MNRRKAIIYLAVMLFLGWGLGIVGWADVSERPPSTHSGSWSQGQRAYSSDNSYTDSTTNNDTHTYGGYGFAIPAGSTITTVEVGGEYYTNGDDIVGIDVSWDGGTSWSSVQNLTVKTSDNNTVEWKDFTAATAWNDTNLNDTNFRVRIKYIQVGGSAGKNFLDYLPARVTYTPSGGATTTIGNGTNPANATIAPGTTNQPLDAFTLQTSSGTDSVTAVRVTTANTAAVSTLYIKSDDGLTTYGSSSLPAGNDWNISVAGLTATTTLTPYKVYIDAKGHAALAAGTYAVTGTVTQLTSTNTKIYNDSGSATLTVDNSPPANATWGTITPSNAQVALNWTNPADSDFSAVLILRNTTSPITDAPTDGTTYTAGNPIGASTIVYVGSSTTYTDTGLTNGQSYYYKIFAYDTYLNYASGVQTGPHTPTSGDISERPPSTNSGSWSQGQRAYLSNNSYTDSTTNNATHIYGGYGFAIPGGSTITKVEVGGEYYTNGDDIIGIDVSWDGGTSWSSVQNLTVKTSDNNTVEWKDFTAATTWDPTKLNDTNFRVRIKYIQVGGSAGKNFLDYLPARVTYTPSGGATTTIGNGTDPANATIAPGATNQPLDTFTLQTSSGTDSVTAVRVTTANTAAVNTVYIKSDDGSTTYGSSSSPVGNDWNISVAGLTATTTLTPYKVYIDAQGHAALATGTYAVTGTVTQLTSTNTKTYNDSGSATVTVDHSPPANATWGTITPGDAQVALNWTNPTDPDFSAVLILRDTTSIADAPTDGTTYTAGDGIGTSTVVYVSSGTTYTDTGLTNGQSYYYKIFTYDTYLNYASGVETGPHTPTGGGGPTTTIGNGTDPANATIAPGATNRPLDAFTLQTSTDTDSVTAVRVTTANTAAVNTVYIKSDDGSTTYGSSSSPSGNDWNISVAGLTATTTLTPYKVYIDAKGHAALATGTYAVTGTVTQLTSTNTKTYNDSGSATITVDNSPPANATWGTITPGDTQVALNWTNPADADFSAVLILRNTTSPITNAPTDGTTYTAGNPIGASTVVYVGSGATYTDIGLTNGQSYYYKIFAYDTYLNYASGVETGPHTPTGGGGPTTTIGNGTDPANATIAPGATNRPLDAFTLQTSTGTDSVTTVQVTTANTAAVSSVYIKSDDGLTTYGSSSSPVGNDWNISVAGLTATTTLTPYKVYIDAKGHAALAAGTYAVTGTVTQITSTNTKTYNDSGSATITVDNSPPANATWGTITPGDTQIALNWTNPTNPDFSAVLILRDTTSPITNAPTDGTTYTAGNTIGASTVVYVGSSTTYIDTGLTNGQSYYYKIFAYDTYLNYASGVETGPYIPTAGGVSGDGYLLRRDNTGDTCGGPNKGCHNVQVHNSTTTGSAKRAPTGWGIPGGWGGEFTCRTCHTPHNTRNIFVIKEGLNLPDIGSRSIDFRYKTGTAGSAPYAMGDDTGGHTTSTRVCEVCHNITNYHRYNTTGQSNLTHNNALDCTSCHTHTTGFKPGESSGNQSCACHSNLFDPMNSTSGYHHFLNNRDVTTLASGSKYPQLSQPATPGDQTDANRRCLMCHVDHDIFRPDLNASNILGRAANLRTDISTLPSTTSGYANTDFVNSGNGGICLSCHNTGQTKSYPQPDGTTQTPPIPYEDALANQVAAFNASAHQYTVNGTFNTDSSTFQGNCSKCHIDTLTKEKNDRFGLHDSTLRRILAVLGISSPADPLEENFCYRCHSRSTDTTPGGGPPKGLADYDYYGVRAMSTNAQLIYRDINTGIGTVAAASTTTVVNVSGTTGWAASQWTNYFLEITSGALAGQSRRISSNTATSITVSVAFSAAPAAGVTYQIGGVHDVEAYSGIHKSVEGTAADWNTGATRHVECEDCHNPHAAAAGLSRTSGTVASSAATTLTANGTPNWPVDRWKGYVVNITTTGRGQARYIASNTASTLTIVGNWSTNPLASDSFILISAAQEDGGVATGGSTTTLDDTSRAWTTDQWVGYYIQTVSGTGGGQVRQVIANTATSLTVNPSWTVPAYGTGYILYRPPLIAEANWGSINGVDVSVTTDGTMRNTSYASQAAVLTQYDLCLKCHSTWAYNLETSAPNVSSNYPSAYDTFNTNTIQQTDVGKDFDVDNYAYHPLLAPGKNQPLRMGDAGSPSWAPNISYNTNWPFYSTGTVSVTSGSAAVTLAGGTFPAGVGAGYWIHIGSSTPINPTTSGIGGGGEGWWPVASRDSTTSLTLAVPFPGTSGSYSYRLTKGLKSNFVDGWGPESLVTCTDCHNTSSATTARGPHGAANRWFLRNQEAQTVTDINGTVTTTAVNNPLTFCLNCHNKNVYGDSAVGGSYTSGTNSSYGRVSHPAGSSSNAVISSGGGFYQIPCMNCHGGAAYPNNLASPPGTPGPGQIHGSNLGVGYAGTSPRGFRFMNGSTWNGHTTNQTGGSSTCYNIGTANSLSGCKQHPSGQTISHNYAY